MKVKVKKNSKKFNEYRVAMVLTEGAVLALVHALQKHAESGSAVAGDLLGFLSARAADAGIKMAS